MKNLLITGGAGFIGSHVVRHFVKKYKKILDTGKVKTVCDESLGFKELAYPINNKNSGFFHLFQYETEKIDFVKKLETELKRDRSILRYISSFSVVKDALEVQCKKSKR